MSYTLTSTSRAAYRGGVDTSTAYAGCEITPQTQPRRALRLHRPPRKSCPPSASRSQTSPAPTSTTTSTASASPSPPPTPPTATPWRLAASRATPPPSRATAQATPSPAPARSTSPRARRSTSGSSPPNTPTASGLRKPRRLHRHLRGGRGVVRVDRLGGRDARHAERIGRHRHRRHDPPPHALRRRDGAPDLRAVHRFREPDRPARDLRPTDPDRHRPDRGRRRIPTPPAPCPTARLPRPPSASLPTRAWRRSCMPPPSRADREPWHSAPLPRRAELRPVQAGSDKVRLFRRPGRVRASVTVNGTALAARV